jgi:hypothetical protein
MSWRGAHLHTWRAGVRVPSTSNKQIVFLIGRSSNGGYAEAPVVTILNNRARRSSELLKWRGVLRSVDAQLTKLARVEW